MLDRLAAWRQNPKIWAVPLGFLVLNLLALLLFQTAFAGRVDALKRLYDRQAERLEQLRSESGRAERFIAAIEAQDQAGEQLYEDYFASEGLRFTKTLREVRNLAREVGMNPRQFSYPEDMVEDYGLTRRGMNFPVTGTYEQLRKFINLLELTDTFIALESVQLGEIQGARGGTADPRLSVNLSLSSMFVDTEYIPPSEAGDGAASFEVAPAEGEPEAPQDPDEET